MTRRRWIADEFSPSELRAALTGANAAHLAKVLRAHVGQEFEIAAAVSAGPEETPPIFLARIVRVAPERVDFELLKQITAPALPIEITMLLSVFKFDRMEWAIEKLTELGVATLIPVVAQRTEKHLAHAAEKRRQRWQRIVHEAAQQSRRATPPTIGSPVTLKQALQKEFDIRIVLRESGERKPLRACLAGAAADRVALAIGPEGGWAPAEEQAFADHGWLAASLGETILRAETAAIAAIAIARAEMEQAVENTP